MPDVYVDHFMTWVLECGAGGLLYEHAFTRAQLQVGTLALATFTDSAGRQCRRFHREVSQGGPWTSVDGTTCRVGGTWTSQDPLR